ncbi:MAG: hypothetical protein JXR69_10570 [Candidatus Delongbacteria bacterium]|nr:hypothetical protein [Candidatus Delongbacteria bacterium]
MLILKDIKLLLKDKYAVLSLIFILIFQMILIYYTSTNTLMKIYLNSPEGVYIFLSKIMIIIFTLVFLSNFLQTINQFTKEKENFLFARSTTSGVKKFIKSKVLLTNLTLVLITQPFYWTFVLLNRFQDSIEMRFLFYCSFVLLFTTMSITVFSSYFVLDNSFHYNGFILGVKKLLALTFISGISLMVAIITIILPIIYIYGTAYSIKYYDLSNITYVSVFSVYFIILISSRYCLNKVSNKIESTEV